jgi:hypothetical protein
VNLHVGHGIWVLRQPFAGIGADWHECQMVAFRPVNCGLDELARDPLATECFRDAGVNQEQTVAPASVDKFGLAAVLRPEQAVVSGVAHHLS